LPNEKDNGTGLSASGHTGFRPRQQFFSDFGGNQRGQLNACIEVLISDKEDALALQKAQEAEIPHVFIDPRLFSDRAGYESAIVKELQAREIDLVVLAGYMRLVGKVLLQAYPHRILNIHPALLPAFTGLHAQRQAVAYGVKLSGCTVHLVDDGMDTGPIIAQAVVRFCLTIAKMIWPNASWWRSTSFMPEFCSGLPKAGYI
jgi:formyltetrahydrofolate-dependent phosphoribosylglycinamide formyltransferase